MPTMHGFCEAGPSKIVLPPRRRANLRFLSVLKKMQNKGRKWESKCLSNGSKNLSLGGPWLDVLALGRLYGGVVFSSFLGRLMDGTKRSPATSVSQKPQIESSQGAHEIYQFVNSCY